MHAALWMAAAAAAGWAVGWILAYRLEHRRPPFSPSDAQRRLMAMEQHYCARLLAKRPRYRLWYEPHL